MKPIGQYGQHAPVFPTATSHVQSNISADEFDKYRARQKFPTNLKPSDSPSQAAVAGRRQRSAMQALSSASAPVERGTWRGNAVRESNT